MLRIWLKYILIFMLLSTFVNRGLFVFASGTEAKGQAAGKAEINSLLELIVGLVNGNQNGIDEDGNTQESYKLVNISQVIIHQPAVSLDELINLRCTTRKTFFQTKESLPSSLFYGTIEQPPEIESLSIRHILS
jgi:hypothetical protein